MRTKGSKELDIMRFYDKTKLTIFQYFMERTLPSNKIKQENQKPLGPKADQEERNKQKVRGNNEIAS